MVALLALAPIRLKNFAGLTLGTSFKRIGDRWWIVLGRHETKSGAANERPVPRYLNQAIAVYLTLARPILLGRREFVIGEEDGTGSAPDVLTGGLWIGEGGKALGYSAVERAIMETTRQTHWTHTEPTRLPAKWRDHRPLPRWRSAGPRQRAPRSSRSQRDGKTTTSRHPSRQHSASLTSSRR